MDTFTSLAKPLQNRISWPRAHKVLMLSVILLFSVVGLSLTPVQAFTLDNCKGFSETGYLECSSMPQVITPWQYMIPAVKFSTPFYPTEGQAIDDYKAQWADSLKTCQPITFTLGDFDPYWIGPNGNWDYGRFFLQRRKPYTLTLYDTTDPLTGQCVPYEMTTWHYLYQIREASCGEGWDNYGNAFCYRFDPEDTSCPTDTPTLPGTGVKVLREEDVSGAGVDPLHFTHHYRSRWPNGVPSNALPMGAGWTHTYDRSIHLVQGAPAPMLRALRGDGSRRTFVRDDSSSTATSIT